MEKRLDGTPNLLNEKSSLGMNAKNTIFPFLQLTNVPIATSMRNAFMDDVVVEKVISELDMFARKVSERRKTFSIVILNLFVALKLSCIKSGLPINLTCVSAS